MRYLESSLLSSDTSRHPRPPLPSPGLLPSPRPPFPFPSPSPRGLHNSASLPPLTPPSAFPSPTAFLDLLSPRSPYPLLSPGFRYPTPLTPNFALSSLPQPGILGAGPSPGLQPPPSPGLWFPQSPSSTILKMMMKTTAGLRNSSGDIGGIDSGVQDPSVAGIRWIQDSRDQYTKERLDSVIDQLIYLHLPSLHPDGTHCGMLRSSNSKPLRLSSPLSSLLAVSTEEALKRSMFQVPLPEDECSSGQERRRDELPSNELHFPFIEMELSFACTTTWASHHSAIWATTTLGKRDGCRFMSKIHHDAMRLSLVDWISNSKKVEESDSVNWLEGLESRRDVSKGLLSWPN
ncbi:hypothetical protein ZIOFF_002100 [Zingiber officinale]|uniref:Uncharacterized protein n=1 Tax=Zingiber officinale TaxID=94328 RepID=A0A8J5HWD9_ZINOF|nr:hypothetical protein ZIOFF_002100 [Zingiber officinale]